MKFLRNFLQKRQRETDLKILWPSIKAQSPDLITARVAFLLHCMDDPAWLAKYSGEELAEYCDKLE